MGIQGISDTGELLKTVGPLGVAFVILIIGLVAAAKWFKNMMDGTLADARRERDVARTALEAQANKYLESMTKLGEIQERGFDEVLRELRNNPRRK